MQMMIKLSSDQGKALVVVSHIEAGLKWHGMAWICLLCCIELVADIGHLSNVRQ